MRKFLTSLIFFLALDLNAGANPLPSTAAPALAIVSKHQSVITGIKNSNRFAANDPYYSRGGDKVAVGVNYGGIFSIFSLGIIGTYLPSNNDLFEDYSIQVISGLSSSSDAPGKFCTSNVIYEFSGENYHSIYEFDYSYYYKTTPTYSACFKSLDRVAIKPDFSVRSSNCRSFSQSDIQPALVESLGQSCPSGGSPNFENPTSYNGQGQLIPFGDGTGTFIAPDGEEIPSIVLTPDEAQTLNPDYDFNEAGWDAITGKPLPYQGKNFDQATDYANYALGTNDPDILKDIDQLPLSDGIKKTNTELEDTNPEVTQNTLLQEQILNSLNRFQDQTTYSQGVESINSNIKELNAQFKLDMREQIELQRQTRDNIADSNTELETLNETVSKIEETINKEMESDVTVSDDITFSASFSRLYGGIKDSPLISSFVNLSFPSGNSHCPTWDIDTQLFGSARIDLHCHIIQTQNLIPLIQGLFLALYSWLSIRVFFSA